MGLPPADVVLELTDLKSRYFEYLDAKRWEDLRSIFADDAAFEGYAFDATDADDFVGVVASFLTGVRSQHQGYLPRFRTIDQSTVRGSWRMHDYLTWTPESRAYKDVWVPGMYGIRGYGSYEEVYALTSVGWRVRFSRLTRTRIDPLVGEPPAAPRYDVLSPDPAWLLEVPANDITDGRTAGSTTSPHRR